MKRYLADPYGDPFSIGRGDPRMRSLRKEGTGSGGGDGGTDDGGDDSAEDDSEEKEDEEEDDSEEKKEEEKNPDLAKAIRARDRAKQEARKLREQLAAKDKKDDGEEDKEAKANAKIVRSSARAILAASGVTDKEDQASVLAVLNLADIDVNDDGDPDEDEIEERVDELRRIFGSTSAPTRRVPKTTSAKDKGGNSKETTDPDAARYKRIMGIRR